MCLQKMVIRVGQVGGWGSWRLTESLFSSPVHSGPLHVVFSHKLLWALSQNCDFWLLKLLICKLGAPRASRNTR